MCNPVATAGKFFALVLALFLAHGSTPVSAAEIVCLKRHGDPLSEDLASKLWPSGFRPSADSCEIALMHGTIEKGDHERYRSFYRQHHRALHNLYLVSPGGDAEEATKIGRLVRRYLTTVWAPRRWVTKFMLAKPPSLNPNEPREHLCVGSTCICASACALVWFGGVNRNGEVGLHRPKRTDAEYKALAPADASAVYKRALQEISRYLEEMEAPRPLIDGMVATSSSEIRWVKHDDDQLEYPPSFIEWVDASCGAFTSQEENTLNELSGREGYTKINPSATQPLTASEQMLRKMLFEKWSNRSKCQSFLVHSRRDALPAP